MSGPFDNCCSVSFLLGDHVVLNPRHLIQSLWVTAHNAQEVQVVVLNESELTTATDKHGMVDLKAMSVPWATRKL